MCWLDLNLGPGLISLDFKCVEKPKDMIDSQISSNLSKWVSLGGGLFSLIEKLEHGDSGGAAENPNCGGGNFADRKAKKIRQEERQTIGDMARIWKMVSNETNIQLFALDLFRGNQIRCIASPL